MSRAKSQAKIRSTDVADRRRQEILEAAYAVVAEKGLEGLRTRDVAGRAGVNIATLHYYFGTKDALVMALVHDVPKTFALKRPPASRKARTPLRAHLEDAWYVFSSTPHLATVLQELTLLAHRDPTARAAFKGIHDGWNVLVEQVLRQGIEDGSIRKEVEPRSGARMITSFIMGALLQLGVNPKAFEFEDIARKLERLLSP